MCSERGPHCLDGGKRWRLHQSLTYPYVLKEDAIPDVWKEAMGLMWIEPSNSLRVKWGDRQQDYLWANGIWHEYGRNLGCKELVHVVICYETWTENHSRSTGNIEEKKTRYAWISSKPLTQNNVFMRCTRMARYR